MNLFLEKWIMLILLAFEALLSLPGPVSLGHSYTSHLLISTYIFDKICSFNCSMYETLRIRNLVVRHVTGIDWLSLLLEQLHMIFRTFSVTYLCGRQYLYPLFYYFLCDSKKMFVLQHFCSSELLLRCFPPDIKGGVKEGRHLPHGSSHIVR